MNQHFLIENFPLALVKIGLPAGKASPGSSICVELPWERECSRVAALVAADSVGAGWDLASDKGRGTWDMGEHVWGIKAGGRGKEEVVLLKRQLDKKSCPLGSWWKKLFLTELPGVATGDKNSCTKMSAASCSKYIKRCHYSPKPRQILQTSTLGLCRNFSLRPREMERSSVVRDITILVYPGQNWQDPFPGLSGWAAPSNHGVVRGGNPTTLIWWVRKNHRGLCCGWREECVAWSERPYQHPADCISEQTCVSLRRGAGRERKLFTPEGPFSGLGRFAGIRGPEVTLAVWKCKSDYLSCRGGNIVKQPGCKILFDMHRVSSAGRSWNHSCWDHHTTHPAELPAGPGQWAPKNG